MDFAFNNAGVSSPHNPTTIKIDDNEWDRIMETNLRGVWLCMRHEINIMKKQGGGAIVNCSSVAGWSGQEETALYTASKHAVIGLTRAAAIEFGRKKIRINAVCPGFTETPMLERQLADCGEARKKLMFQAIPLGRYGKPEEIASNVLFLCSDAASYITAKSIVISGGQLIRS